jgi:hypothetical protein
MMHTYPKIPGPFKRHTDGPERNRLIIGRWTSPELEALANLDWTWTEKVDGTNIRVHWDGHRVAFGGRTDNAQIPAKLVEVLRVLFTEEIFEQTFNDTEVTLYGEGFGAGIQSGGIYRSDQGFALFDVRIGQFWLKRQDVVDVANKMGVEYVPLKLTAPISEAIDFVKAGVGSDWNDAKAEGLVGVAPEGLLSRSGERIMVKIKHKDFH